MHIKISIPVIALIIITTIPAYTQKHKTVNIIPKPVSSKLLHGYFTLLQNTVIIIDDKKLQSDADIFNDFLKVNYGLQLKTVLISEANPSVYKSSIQLSYSSVQNPPKDHLDNYRLKVSKNAIKITGDSNGVFYGLQSLKQLIPDQLSVTWKIPCIEIYDYPHFSWRGMHLDVVRHFFPKEFIKKYIDYIAMYKMNVFHWHLTDDQGWRIEIKKYPNLTKIGAYRKGTVIGRSASNLYDTLTYGGFYSQQDIREIVDYANKRHITIVPEIEMPGHSLAALASYPEYSCTGGPFQVASKWGVTDDVYCTKDETFTFLEDILTEVLELFPGKYIHIGGDECSKSQWKKCPRCQEVMKREGLKDESALQSYFIKCIEKFLNSKGRNLMGWDEILEGGLAPNAAVMSWRGTEGGITAANQGHKVVMTPGAYCYFDHYQGNPNSEPLAIGGYTTVEKVYSYNPIPSSIDSSHIKYMLGAQGNVWTEYIPTTEHVEYMVFPRISALSEVLWTPRAIKDYKGFKKRLVYHFNYLDMLKVNYAKSLFEINEEVTADDHGTGIKVNLTQDIYKYPIRYTLDGSTPVPASTVFNNTLHITQSCTLKAAIFGRNNKLQNKFEQAFVILKSTGKKITLDNEPSDKYNYGGATTLVNGILGKLPWNSREWLGFYGDDLIATIDLGNNQPVSKVTVDVLKDEDRWIYLPKSIEIYVSDDGKDFKMVASADSAVIQPKDRKQDFILNGINTRYVKIKVQNQGVIPAGKEGEGYDAWLFCDEIMVE